MRIVKCSNGHFFDRNQYMVCPHCGAAATFAPDSGKSGYKDADDTSINVTIRRCSECGSATDDVEAVFCMECGARLPEVFSEEDKGSTASTVPEEAEEIRESSIDDSDEEIEESKGPVAGWLVCIKGMHAGESFCIFSGRNFIGKLFPNGIKISTDSRAVSKVYAILIFEPRKQMFYIQPGDSSDLTYLDNNMLLEVQELSKGSKIEIGENMFLLYPLCGPDFSWEDYI